MSLARTTGKRCPRCGEKKPRAAFYVRDTGKLSSWCKACAKAGNYERRAKSEKPVYNPRVDVWSHRERRYGLSREQYEAMEGEQDGRCAICREKPGGRGLCVDHDHKTGEVRGLLCNRCNWTLGHMRDNPDFLNNAITYLEHGFVGWPTHDR